MFILYADSNRLTVSQRQPVTSGSVNACPVRFKFSPDWDGLTRTAVFRAGADSRSVLLDESGQCEIPWEVLASHGRELAAGVCGTRGGTLVLPTVWVSLGAILEGAAGGEAASPPTPDIWQQRLDAKGGSLDYDGLTLRLKSGERVLSEVRITGGSGIPVPGPQGPPGPQGEQGPPGESGGEIYSTEEVRIGTWIDGKPLYAKTVQIDFSLSTSQTATGVPLPDGALPKFVDGFIGPTDWGAQYPIYFAEQNGNTLTYIFPVTVNDSVSIINRWVSNTPTTATVTVKYTKASDSPEEAL